MLDASFPSPLQASLDENNNNKSSGTAATANDDGLMTADDNVIVILDDRLSGSSFSPTHHQQQPPHHHPGNIPIPAGRNYGSTGSRNTSLNSSAASHNSNYSMMIETKASSDSASNFNYSDGSNFLPYTPRHSDFTIPTSNEGAGGRLLLAGANTANATSPVVVDLLADATTNNNTGGDAKVRRSIFGNAVQQKYKTNVRNGEDLPRWGGQGGGLVQVPTEFPTDADVYHVHTVGGQHGQVRSAFVSDMTLPDLNGDRPSAVAVLWNRMTRWLGSVSKGNGNDKNDGAMLGRKSIDNAVPPPTSRLSVSSTGKHHHHHHHHARRKRPHETVHAQSLLLGLAFCAVWSANNVMAPNLTEMADFFGLQGAAQRDLYLGSYCALATGVFSFPIAAGIGVLADLMSRQQLFCITVAGGGISALITAQAKTYPVLFMTRLINGGFMAGSTPVAFSFLGDLFAVEERNAASSGLTAMMGLGIILGQVYAGMVGPLLGWQHAFIASGILSLALAALCLVLVQEPERGGKEKVLQDMIRAGTRYDRKLTWEGFLHAVQKNKSNSILLWQGFFSSLPWGVIFVFLNDFLSQERGFSVQAATYLVFLFGLGCAAGGVLGGWWGQVVQDWNRSYLPIFMALTTVLGIFPFLVLLNSHFTHAHSIWGIILAVSCGLVASLPSVNVRPCLINVNPPETRGASLTAANLLISLGRGVGPSCVTMMGSIFQSDRTFSINLTLILFWIISAIQLALLARTLPMDQDIMEAELASYAKAAMEKHNSNDALEDLEGNANRFRVTSRVSRNSVVSEVDEDGNESLEVSIADRMTYFDGTAARQTISYVKEGIEEFQQSLLHCGEIPESSDEESPFPTPNASSSGPLDSGPVWENDGQRLFPDENTPLIV